MADNHPPLPPGFVLEGAAPANSGMPALPPGFELVQPEQQQIKAPIQQPAPEDKSYQGAILPFSVDAAGNKSFDSNAGILGAVKRAVMLPGEAYAGKIDPMSEEGIGRAAEFAGVFGPISPAAGSGKAIASLAKPAERPGMEVAAAANRLGVDLPRAAASDSTAVQQIGKVLPNIPIGGTPLRKSARNAIDQLGDAATRTQEGFGSGNIAQAGSAARQGMTEYATKTLKGRVSDAYNNVDNLVTQNVTTPLSETAKVATDIASRRQNASLGDSGAVGFVRKALEQKDGLNYQGIKDLRTTVGEMLDKPDLTANGFSEGELRRIYAGLTTDLKDAVARSGGPKASQAFEAANQLAAKTSREREALNKVLGRDASDERLFDRISAMAGSNARADRVSLARVRGAVSPETWNEISSGVISTLGRDKDGAFSPDRFITGYGKLSQEGKSALFGGKKELSGALDDIATVSRRFKQLNQFANPSGTAQSGAGIGYLGGAFVDPTSVIGSIVGARLMSSILSKPTSARALAAYAKAYEQQATQPGKAPSQALTNTARAVAAFLGNEAGDKGLAAQIFPQISGVRKVPAGPGNENQNIEENQQRREQQQPRQLMPNEI